MGDSNFRTVSGYGKTLVPIIKLMQAMPFESAQKNVKYSILN